MNKVRLASQIYVEFIDGRVILTVHNGIGIQELIELDEQAMGNLLNYMRDVCGIPMHRETYEKD